MILWTEKKRIQLLKLLALIGHQFPKNRILMEIRMEMINGHHRAVAVFDEAYPLTVYAKKKSKIATFQIYELEKSYSAFKGWNRKKQE